MRTTVTLSDDVAAGIEKERRERGLGLSEAINDLVRAGLTRAPARREFRQKSHDLGRGVDFSNIGEAIETLDGLTVYSTDTDFARFDGVRWENPLA